MELLILVKFMNVLSKLKTTGELKTLKIMVNLLVTNQILSFVSLVKVESIVKNLLKLLKISSLL